MRNTVFIAAAALVAMVAGQAQAHARLIQATPRVGTTVAAPRQLRLQYSESIVLAASSVKVAGPHATALAIGPLALDPKSKRVVIVPFPKPPAPGPYKVTWHMKTEDGHETDGDFAFAVK